MYLSEENNAFFKRKVFCQLNASFFNFEPPISTKIPIIGDWFWAFVQQESYVQKPNEHENPWLATSSCVIKKNIEKQNNFWKVSTCIGQLLNFDSVINHVINLVINNLLDCFDNWLIT